MDAVIVSIVMVSLVSQHAGEGAVGRCGRHGCGSRSCRPATTSGSTAPPERSWLWLSAPCSAATASSAVRPKRRAHELSRRRASPRPKPRGQSARPRQAGVHRCRARDPAPLDAGRREDEADAGHAHHGRAGAVHRRRRARRLRGAQRIPLLLARRRAVRRRLGGGHPRRRPGPRREQGHRVRRLPRLDLRPAGRGGDA